MSQMHWNLYGLPWEVKIICFEYRYICRKALNLCRSSIHYHFFSISRLLAFLKEQKWSPISSFEKLRSMKIVRYPKCVDILTKSWFLLIILSLYCLHLCDHVYTSIHRYKRAYTDAHVSFQKDNHPHVGSYHRHSTHIHRRTVNFTSTMSLCIRKRPTNSSYR